ncbi:hypothetical protein Pan97_35420 [Bremerella volcania]|uniref:Uncharacterized protein n=1 Tax=Bremerella volcania TaxID=2527984 RepID=A0A518CB89_9BACT|nr:hypothetical protein [Bremerella volcania]QDU76492.1 hypothetical protein Pan97_35420 [Bremerella volcania]
MLFSYIGPGIGAGALVVLAGILIAGLFLFYAFIYLPIRLKMRNANHSSKEAELPQAESSPAENQDR